MCATARNALTLTDAEKCPICSNERRDHSTIMVVENTRDLAAYEENGKIRGRFITSCTEPFPPCSGSAPTISGSRS